MNVSLFWSPSLGMIVNPALFGATIRAWDNGADLQTDNMILLTKAKAKDRHHGVESPFAQRRQVWA